MQVGDTAHRQARQVGDLNSQRSGYRDRQGSDRCRLVDDHQSGSVGDELGEDLDQRRFVVGQWSVVQPFPDRVQRARVVLRFAHVQAAEDRVRNRDLVAFGQPHPPTRSSRPSRTPAPAATLRADHASGSGLYQRSLAPSVHGDNTPQIINDRGSKSCRGRWPASPHRV